MSGDGHRCLRFTVFDACLLVSYARLSRDNSDSDDDEADGYPSLDSVPSDNSLPSLQLPAGGAVNRAAGGAEATEQPPTLTESMLMMDEILADKTMDRQSRIDKLEAILSTATQLQSDQVGVTLLKIQIRNPIF